MINMIIRTMDLVECIADAIDLISPEVNHHHRRVICISHYLGKAYGLSTNQLENLIVAAAVHDIGALTAKNHLDLLRFDETEGTHAKYGSRLLMGFTPLAHIAPIIRYHHTPWQDVAHADDNEEKIPIESRILYLADRISVLIHPDLTLNHVDDISKLIVEKSGSNFHPDLVEIYRDVAQKESFWLDARDIVVHPMLEQTLARNLHLKSTDILSLGKLFSQIIDFRSSFTAAHSSGIAAVASALAEIMGFSADECFLMRLAGDLHDIGKLVVPETILEKKGSLSPDEFSVIRSHTYYTNRLLLGIQAFDTIRVWGALHHEKLNGKGYPFKLTADEIPLGSRIMAVADIYTAITEDRPYRIGMTFSETSKVMNNMVENGSIDYRVVGALFENYDYINNKRMEAQEKSLLEYREFYVE